MGEKTGNYMEFAEGELDKRLLPDECFLGEKSLPPDQNLDKGNG